MLRVCSLFCIGGAALRVGTELADVSRSFTMTIEVTGAPLDPDETIGAITENGGRFLADLNQGGNPATVLARPEGEQITVGVPPYYNDCSYVVGKSKTTCIFRQWLIVFTSEEEVEETSMAMITVTRNGLGNEPPFQVKIDEKVMWTESGPIDQHFSFWRMTDVDGPGVVVTVLFLSTNTECTYTVAKTTSKETRQIEGWVVEFETMVSKNYSGNYTEFVSKLTHEKGWKVHLNFEGAGPQVDVFLNSEIVTKVGPQDSGRVPILFDAEIGQNVKIAMSDGTIQIPDIVFTVGDEKQFFEKFAAYTVMAETVAKN